MSGTLRKTTSSSARYSRACADLRLKSMMPTSCKSVVPRLRGWKGDRNRPHSNAWVCSALARMEGVENASGYARGCQFRACADGRQATPRGSRPATSVPRLRGSKADPVAVGCTVGVSSALARINEIDTAISRNRPSQFRACADGRETCAVFLLLGESVPRLRGSKGDDRESGAATLVSSALSRMADRVHALPRFDFCSSSVRADEG